MVEIVFVAGTVFAIVAIVSQWRMGPYAQTAQSRAVEGDGPTAPTELPSDLLLEIKPSLAKEVGASVLGVAMGCAVWGMVTYGGAAGLSRGVRESLGGIVGVVLGVLVTTASRRRLSIAVSASEVFGPADRKGRRSRIPVSGLDVTPILEPARHGWFSRRKVCLVGIDGSSIALYPSLFTGRQLRQLEAAIREAGAGAA